MATQSYGYGGSGLFGQPSFGDYSGLSGGVPVPMTPEQIQQQLAYQQDPYGGLAIYQDLYNTQEGSGFLQNVNARYRLPTNPYVNPPPDLEPVPRMDYTQRTAVVPVEAVNQMDVRNDQGDTSSNVAAIQETALPVNTGYSGTRLVSDSPIVSGVFPEVEAMQRALYQQKQNEAMQAQAYQFAQLSPMQQAQYSLYMGGQQLGGAIGSALGGKDPQLQLISMRNAISRQIDMRDPESYFKAATLANQAGDREFATSLVEAGTKIESTMSQVELRKAQAQKAKNYQQTQTDSAQKRKTVSELEQKLATDPTYKPSAKEIADVRWIVANESQNRTQIDPVTGQLYIIEGLNIIDAAPNIANYLKQTATTVPAPATTTTTPAPAATEAPATLAPAPVTVAKGVTAVATEASKIKAEELEKKRKLEEEEKTRAIESFDDQVAAIQNLRNTIKTTNDLISPYTTGYGSLLSILPATDARTLEGNTQTIKNNVALSKLRELKQQSATGASGLGALNMKEFDAIQGIIAALDPKSKNYKNDLEKIDSFFARAENLLQTQSERAKKNVGSNASAPSGSRITEEMIQFEITRQGNLPQNSGMPRDQIEKAVRASAKAK